MPLFGQPIPRVEDRRFLTGGAAFVCDLDLPGVASVAYAISPVAHARIVAIDTSAARDMPGVLDVVVAADVDLAPMPAVSPEFPAATSRSLLATGTVRFVGEPFAAIVAETQAQADDAAAAVYAEWDPLPAVPTLDAARAGDVVLFPDAGTNLVLSIAGGSETRRPESEVVVRATFRSPRLAPAPLEVRAAAARWEDDGRLTYWLSCQGPHPVRNLLAQVYGLDAAAIRVIAPDVGGSFGAKARPYPEDVLLPWLSRRVGRPVRWIPNRSDDMTGLGHGRAQEQHVELRGTPDGRFESLDVRVVADAGAYPAIGAMLPRNTGSLASGPYRIPWVHWSVESYVTNTTPTVAYRGAGRPEAAAIIERAVDLYAMQTGIDPAELRRRNFIGESDFPHTTPTGVTYDTGTYAKALDLALDIAGYDSLRGEQAARRSAGDRVQVGIGIAAFIDRTAGVPGAEYGSVEVIAGGRLRVRTGSSPYGQGHHTAWTMLVADRTGVAMADIEVVHGDTDTVPRGGITGGSRSVQKAGAAVAAASELLVDRARAVAADLLEASVDDVVLDVAGGGRFHVAGTPARSIGWAELAAHPGATGDGGELRCEADVESASSFPSGTYVAVVDVDIETGRVVLRRLITVDDAGAILNPLLAGGQVHGGAAQGIGQALFEEFVYDAAANPLSATLADYGLPGPREIPSFEGAFIETLTPHNALGAKGIAESGTIGAPPAVQNAVVDALSHLGVRHVDMPCSPERVWRAIQAAFGQRHGAIAP